MVYSIRLCEPFIIHYIDRKPKTSICHFFEKFGIPLFTIHFLYNNKRSTSVNANDKLILTFNFYRWRGLHVFNSKRLFYGWGKVCRLMLFIYLITEIFCEEIELTLERLRGSSPPWRHSEVTSYVLIATAQILVWTKRTTI